MRVVCDTNVLQPEALNVRDYPNMQRITALIEDSPGFNESSDFSLIGSVDNLTKLYPPYANDLDLEKFENNLNLKFFYKQYVYNDKIFIRFIGNLDPYGANEVYIVPSNCKRPNYKPYEYPKYIESIGEGQQISIEI